MKRYILSLRVFNGNDTISESEGTFEIIDHDDNEYQPFFSVKNPAKMLDIEKRELNPGDYSSICDFIEKMIENPDPAKAEKMLKKINTMLWFRVW